MAGINRSIFARTLGMLCLLGIGLGIGTIIIFHLLRHILKRKPTHPPSDDDDDDKDENLGPVLPSDRPLENQDEASANSCSVNPNDSVRSFEGSGCSGDVDHEVRDLTTSVCSEDSIDLSSENLAAEWDSENLATLQQSDNAVLRRRKFEGSRHGDEAAVEMGRCNDLSISSPSSDSVVKSDKSISLSADFIRRSSSSDNISSGSLRSFNSGTNLDLSMASVDYLTNAGLYSGNEDKDEFSLFRRRASQNVMPEIFDHSTPVDHLPLSFHRRRSHLDWMYSPNGFAIDSDVVAKSMSCYDCVRDSPVASRSCVSVDLGVMSAVSSVISDLDGDRRLSCYAVNNMEKLQDELSIIQSEMEEIRDKVGQLQSQGRPQYKLCNFDVSVDEDLEPVITPRQQMLYEMHQMPAFEGDLSQRNSDYMWDYDFDVEVKDDKRRPLCGSEFEGENIGQLESFVMYQTKKAARDSFRRKRCSLSQSIDMLRLSRSDSVFDCSTPSFNEDFLDKKSCNLFDVNRRLSGHLVIPELGEFSDV